MLDPKELFSDRVEDYVRFRPGYPPALVDLLERECHLGPSSVVADLGSGTGLLSKLLLGAGARVRGVEPNAAMRAAAERAMGADERFTSVAASAEATGLPPASVDLATAGQAFHWFDAKRVREELVRILRWPGRVALVWNMRARTPFNDDYDRMLGDFAPDYAAVRAYDRAAESKVQAFFAPRAAQIAHFRNAQHLDEPGLRGRLMSASYAPKADQPAHAPLMSRLATIFAAHARDGRVELTYDTIAYWGTLS